MNLRASGGPGSVTPLKSAIGSPPKSATPPTSPKKQTLSPAASRTSSPRKTGNKRWKFKQKKRAYLQHLREWSLNHDSSAHFHGAIKLHEPARQAHDLELGQSVRCSLTSSLSTNPLDWKHVVIRLFPPHEAGGRYRLVVRSGAGWVSARDYLSKEHFMRWEALKSPQGSQALAELQKLRNIQAKRPQVEAESEDVVAIRPLFHPFIGLPKELQQYILAFALNKQDVYSPGKQGRFKTRARGSKRSSIHIYSSASLEPPTLLSAIFSISKSLNEHLIPWMFRTTNFHFGTQGFTNFLWLAGPINRTYINKITLKFGHYALLHCIRWLAPDPIFLLFDPPLHLQPRGMQYYWRCQIQNLARELHLQQLSIELHDIPKQDIPFVTRILQGCFGSIERVHYLSSSIETCHNLVQEEKSWSDLSRDAFVRYQNSQWHMDCFSSERITGTVEDLERDMQENAEFFAEPVRVDVG